MLSWGLGGFEDWGNLQDLNDFGDFGDLGDLGNLGDLGDLGDLRDLGYFGDLGDLRDLGYFISERFGLGMIVSLSVSQWRSSHITMLVHLKMEH